MGEETEKPQDTGPDRGVLDMRGMFFIFIGLVGAVMFYAKDDDGTRAAFWFIVCVGTGCSLIARAFRQQKLGAVLVAMAGVVGGVFLYQNDADNLIMAIGLAGIALGSGAYLFVQPPPK